MRKYLIHLVIFVALVAIADYVIGAGFLHMRDHAQSGTFQELEYAAENCNDDILIFGSSRALHHYSPKVITDSLGLSCHNFGHEGMCFLYSFGIMQLISSHHVPKVILYDYCRFDSKKDDPLTYLAELRPFYEYPCIKSYLNELVPEEEVKNLSHLYRFNSKPLQLFNGIINKTKRSDGFQPLKGHIKRFKGMTYGSDVDSIKYKYMTQMIDFCQARDIKLIFFISPFYNGLNHTYPEDFQKLFREKGIPFFDNQDLKEFTFNTTYFRDRTHLNKDGATAYTQYIIHQIKESLE